MRLKINHSLLSDSPFCEQNKGLFQSASHNYKDLINDITIGSPTSYLISGYRGVGKTSFIKQLEALIKKEKLSKESKDRISLYEKSTGQKETVFVHVNFSKYQNQTFLLRKLTRRLYLEIKDLDSFKDMKASELRLPPGNHPAHLLEQLYDKTFYESSSSNTLSHKKERVLVLHIDFILLLKFVLPLIMLAFFIYNIFFHAFDVSTIINYGGIVLSLISSVNGFIKISSEKKKTKTEQEDFNRKSMYDDEIADYHFYSLLEAFHKSYKVIFVLDELDKVDEKDIDKLLNEMKPYLVSGVAAFIVVGGQNLFYKYTKSKTEDDALLSSIFTKCIHIPLLTREEFQLLFDSLVLSGPPTGSDEIKNKNEYVDYLVFQSKRIPRKFIGLIREDLYWESGDAFIDIDNTGDRYKVYAQILDIIDDIDDKEIATEGFDGAIRDFFVMQLFLKSNRILFSRENTFLLSEIKTSYE